MSLQEFARSIGERSGKALARMLSSGMPTKEQRLNTYMAQNPQMGMYEAMARTGAYSTSSRPTGDWETAAKLTREQYSDWRLRYLPFTARLADLSENNSLMNAQLARTGGIATASLQAAQTAKANQMARYGVNRPDNPNSHTLGLRNALAIAGAKNGVREAEQDRQMNILTGGAATARQQLNIGGQMQAA